MKLARFWTRGNARLTGPRGPIEVRARGWSDESLDNARICAQNIARRVAERLISHPQERNQYQYGDRPLPEPLIRQLDATAVVTRNAYGSLVLNVDQLMFVDIDRANAIDGIRTVAQRHGLSARVYQTAGGYRVMIPHMRFAANGPDSVALLTEFGSDPLYIHLCRMQSSFRARLTPKPWRCDFRKPPVEFPFETPQDDAQFRQWEAEYNARAGRYATCRYEATFGGVRTLPEFEAAIEYHDQETKANMSLPLA
jgi:hypothetical protein